MMLHLSEIKAVCALYFLITGWGLVNVTIVAQESEIVYTNQQEIDPERYSDIKGDPMYFDQWIIGSIMRNDAMIFEDLKLNYNGYSKTIEINKDGKLIELEGDLYLRVDIDASKNPDQAGAITSEDFAMQRNFHPKFGDDFVFILYHAPNITLIKQFWADVSKHEVQDVGKTVEFKRFNRKELYFVRMKGALEMVKLKRKSVFEVFDDPRIAEYVKSQNLRLTTEQELVELAKFYSMLD